MEDNFNPLMVGHNCAACGKQIPFVHKVIINGKDELIAECCDDKCVNDFLEKEKKNV